LETSVLRGSVALGCGGALLAHRVLPAERRNAAALMPAIREILPGGATAARGVDVLAFSQGPGSFTGLRVAATIARMWQSATGCRVVAVPTLEVIARNVLALPQAPKEVAVVVDARQGKVFAARFAIQGDTVAVIEPAALHVAADWLATLPAGYAVIGDGVAANADQIAGVNVTPLPDALALPDARQVLAIATAKADAGAYCLSEQILPAYHRPPECEEVYEQRRAAARERRGE
jgi:tRNA threonylcarbamoyladenosine biosynthesis protein TsaB